MKRVIFICLLSLSVCLSQQNPTQDVQSPQQQANAGSATQPQIKPGAATGTAYENSTNVTTAANSTLVQPSPSAKETQSSAASNTQSNTSTTNETKENATKPEDNKENKASKNNETMPPNAAGEKVDTKTEPTKNKTESNVPADKVTNGTKTDDNKKNDVTTPKTEDATTPKSETAKTTEKPVVLQKRAFDGPSFIGGIILTLGLLAIGFMGFKYYKNQTERNYHTL